MTLENQCPKCNGFANTYIVDFTGDRYYKCTRGITRLLDERPHISNCDTVFGSDRQPVSGVISWLGQDGKIQTVTCNNGREIRSRGR